MNFVACVVAWSAWLAGVADAGTVTPPARWTSDPETAASLSRTLGAVPHFAGRNATVTTEAYRAPGNAGALYVTRVVANAAPADRDRAATAELAELAAPVTRQGVRPDETKQRATNDRTLDGEIAWRDSSGVATRSRIVIAADSQQLVAVIGECMVAGETPDGVGAACAAALATLDPGIALANRERIQLVPGESEAVAGSPIASSGPVLRDGAAHPTLTPMSIPPDERETDRRPIYVGAGLVVLACIFWWNRRRRERFEPDADADDLHAAATSQRTDHEDNQP